MKVVQLHEGPSLQDIAGQLEQLAADIRAGVESPTLAMVVLRDAFGDLDAFGFGQTGSDDECAGVLLRAAQHCTMRADLKADEANPDGPQVTA